MSGRARGRSRDGYAGQPHPPNTGGRREDRSDSYRDEQYEGSRGGSRGGYDREAPQSRGAGGYDREAPQSHGDRRGPSSRGAGEYDRGAQQTRGAERYDREAPQSRGAEGYDRGAPHTRGAERYDREAPQNRGAREYDRGAQQSRGAEGYDRGAQQSRGAKGYDRGAPQARGPEGYDRGAQQTRGAEGYDKGSQQSRGGYDKGPSGYGRGSSGAYSQGYSGGHSQGSSSGYGRGASGYGRSDSSRDFHQGERSTQGYGTSRQTEQPQWVGHGRGQSDTRPQGSRGGQRGHAHGDQGHRGGYESRPQGSGQHQARYPDTRQGGGDGGQGKSKQLEEMMAKMAVGRESGKQLSLAGWRGDLTDMPADKPMHELVRYGSIGEKVKISTNLFRFEVKEKKFYQYNVEFSPSIESTRLKRKLVKSIEEQLGMTSNYVTDGSSLYTTVLLNKNLLMDIEATYKRTTVYKVTIKHVATIEPNSHLVIQILNVIFGSLLQNKGWRWSDGSYYDYSQMIPINQTSMSAYPGFFTSILEYKSGIRLMLDVSHKIITSQNAWEACQYDGRTLMTRIIGKIVYTCYNAKTYKVDDVDLTKTVTATFKYRDGEISIMEYYKVKYGVTITDMNQPLLVVKPNRKQQRSGAPDIIYLVPELCLVTGIDERDRSNYQFMKNLDVVTKPVPNTRAHKMEDFVKDIQKDQAIRNTLEAFGIEFGKSMESVEGRALPGIMASQNLNQVTRNKLFATKSLTNWKILHPANQRTDTVDNFIDQLNICMKQMGMQYRDPEVRTYRDNKEMQRHLEDTPSNSDLVMVIMRGNNKAEYSNAKKILCVKNPIPSQVVTCNLVERKAKPAVCAKVALQMNCKMGGAGWSIRNMNTKDTMVVGVDTYHDSETRGASYMGVVATLDDFCTKYHTTWCKHDSGREIAVSFRPMLTECLNAYFKENRRPCKRVVIYRDGVGDGQLGHLMESEVKDTEKAIADMGWNTGVVYVVVKKRIHSRFFLKRGGVDSATYENVRKGIVIDEGATRPGWMDFFLINQDAKEGQGTLTPTHFNVVLNSSDMTIDAIQLLTYQQCFMYFNWNDSIRVPATCQYAHKVAFLIGQAVHCNPSDKLKSKLFYL